MRIQYSSDHHIEFYGLRPKRWPELRIEPEVDVLVLAGDVASGLLGPLWVRWVLENQLNASNLKAVIIVAGNHEYYGKTLGHHTRRLQSRYASIPRCHFLERESLLIDGVLFLGCTLWTDFNLKHTQTTSMDEAKLRMNDYHRVRARAPQGGYPRLNPNQTLSIHAQSASWLNTELSWGKTEGHKSVIVTHHAPSAQSLPVAKRYSSTAPAYASDMTRMCSGDSAPRAWIHGHVHNEPMDYVLGSSRVVSYTWGYPVRSTGGTIYPSRLSSAVQPILTV